MYTDIINVLFAKRMRCLVVTVTTVTQTSC
jgi:hypothetical protein